MLKNYKQSLTDNHKQIVNATSCGTLYIVATPIGNLKDLSFRALEVLKNVKKIACEDTRTTARLLAYHDIKQPLMSYHEHSTTQDIQKILDNLLAGDDVAVVSDAGTPLVSDPGYSLIQAAIEHNIPLTTIPGPCSVIAALTLSGLPTNQFHFCGFLANKSVARQKEIASMLNISATLVFFETAKRLSNSLQDLLTTLGNRRIAVIREITKLYEEVYRGTITSAIEEWKTREPKGEFVLVIEGNINTALDNIQLHRIMQYLLQKMSLKEATEFARECLGANKKQVYDIGLKINENGE